MRLILTSRTFQRIAAAASGCPLEKLESCLVDVDSGDWYRRRSVVIMGSRRLRVAALIWQLTILGPKTGQADVSTTTEGSSSK